MGKKLTNNQFKERSKIIHNNFYNYDKSNYKNNKTYITITCPIHSDFEQLPMNHLKGDKCIKCIKEKQRIKYENKFIIQSSKINKYFYNYDKINYIDNSTDVIITCPIHGDFEQLPYNHLNGYGCRECGILKRRKILLKFIEESNMIHNNFFNYDKINYINNSTDVIITCPIHGDFPQTPKNHTVNKQGCSKCAGNYRYNTKEYIDLVSIVHNNFYSYNKTIYDSSKNDIIISCPIHGDFEQNPRHHLNGCGCSICNFSKGEKEINKILTTNKIEFEIQKKFKDCIYKSPLKFDFYLSKYNTCIEYDGVQHFESVKYFGGDVAFKRTQERDKIKTEYCLKNNIKLIRISYNDNIYSKLSYNVDFGLFQTNI